MIGLTKHNHPEALSERESERDLIRRCIAGDRQAQDELYLGHRRQVAANLYRVLGDPVEVEDLIQEVFLIAFRSLDKFRGDSRLSTWLYRIAVNVALGKLRQRKRRPQAITAEPHMLEERGTPPRTPEAELLSKRSRERVYEILSKLSPKKRIVLYLHEIEGRELKEIAFLVEANPVTVRTRLYYARREFYRRLAEDDE